VTEAKLKTWINELIEAKLIIPVDYKTKMLLFVKGWGEHQTVANKSKRSHIENDDLEDVIKETLDTNEILISNYLLSHAPKRKKKVIKRKVLWQIVKRFLLMKSMKFGIDLVELLICLN
jgi:hypothetical protein